MFSKRFAVTPALIAVLAAANLGSAQALDIRIENGQTVGLQTLSGPHDTLTVESGGTIDINSIAVSVDIAASNALITNHGVINTYDMSSYAIHTLAANTSLVNYGGIYTYGDCAYGIYSEGNYFSLTNEGTIETSGAQAAYGVYVTTPSSAVSGSSNALNTILINNGQIITNGYDSHSVTIFGTGTQITNTGLISTAGDGSVGIYAYSKADESNIVITNSGTVRATGEVYHNSTYSSYQDAHAIQTRAKGVHIINSGTVYSEHGEAFAMEESNQTLTLLPGSQIYGGIRYANASTGKLVIGKGLETQLTLKSLPGTIDTQGQPYGVVSLAADQHIISVFSEASFQGSSAITANLATTMTGALGTHNSTQRAAMARSATPVSSYTATPQFPDFAPKEDFGLWASGFGSASGPAEGKSAPTVHQGGGLVGFDARLSEDSFAGVFIGYGRGVIENTTDTKVDVSTLVGGAYSSISFGAAFVDLSATLGASASASSRKVLTNTHSSGFETATADYTSVFITPSAKLGYDYELELVRITPSVTATYSGIAQPGYTEKGATANITLGNRNTHVLAARAEIELGTIALGTFESGWNGSFKLGVDGTITSNADTQASLHGKHFTFAGSNSTQTQAYVGGSIGYQSGGFSVSTSGQFGYTSAGTYQLSLQGGLKAKF